MTKEAREEKEGWRERWKGFPKAVFPIFGNEFCERFSYYGMRTVLTLYLVNVMGLSGRSSVALYHGFTVFAYSTPLLGSVLADGYIGKFHTILWISLLYASGNVILAIAAANPPGSAVHPALDYVGLFVIALGTGGIKPCVSAFGGDQFKRGQERMLEAFFSIFYFAINAGSLLSHLITPLIRTTSCLGEETCYPAAFGMPAGLMVLAVLLFLAGSPWYTRKPPSENVIGLVAKAIARAGKNMLRSDTTKPHFMDHLVDGHSCDEDPRCSKARCGQAQLADDVKSLLRVSVMYLPVPVFWALFDQQGSTWVLQAVLMNGSLGGGVTLLPDQMGIFNTFLILAFIPFFQGVVYPGVRKVGIDPTPLRRMVAGGFLASASFVVACFVQLAVNGTTTQPPDPGSFGLTFANTFSCPVNVTPGVGNTLKDASFLNIPPEGTMTKSSLAIETSTALTASWTVTGPCVPPSSAASTVTSSGAYFLSAVGPRGSLGHTARATVEKATTGEGQFKIGLTEFLTNDGVENRTLFWCACPSAASSSCSQASCDTSSSANFHVVHSGPEEAVQFVELLPGAWRLFYSQQQVFFTVHRSIAQLLLSFNDSLWQRNASLITATNVTFATEQQGGVYRLVLFSGRGLAAPQTLVWTVAPPNTVSILWQVPQYVIITAGEILFSITGLEFSYSQAPASMKSVIQAVWLLTVAGGDLIDVIIALAPLGIGNAYLLLLFAGLMALVTVAFLLMAVFWYEYADRPNADGEEGDEVLQLAGPSAHQLVEGVQLDE